MPDPCWNQAAPKIRMACSMLPGLCRFPRRTHPTFELPAPDPERAAQSPLITKGVAETDNGLRRPGREFFTRDQCGLAHACEEFLARLVFPAIAHGKREFLADIVELQFGVELHVGCEIGDEGERQRVDVQ